MRVTLTKHRGHGMKPLSCENKEILSSFVRQCLYLRLPTILFLFRLLSLLPFLFHLLLSKSVCQCSDYYDAFAQLTTICIGCISQRIILRIINISQRNNKFQ